MICTERYLLHLSEIFIGVTAELKFADISDGDGHKLFRLRLRGIEDVELEVVLVSLGNYLDAELPLAISSILNCHSKCRCDGNWDLG